MAIEIGITDLNIYDDSQLVINQLLDEYKVKKEDLVPYHRQAFTSAKQVGHGQVRARAKECQQEG